MITLLKFKEVLALKISRMLKIMIIVILLLLILNGISISSLISSMNERTDAIEEELELKELSSKIYESINFRSEQLSNYALLEKSQYLHAYNSSSNMEEPLIKKVMDRLKKLDAPEKLIRIMNELKVGNENLLTIESEVLKGMESGDVGRAQALITGEGYKVKKSALKGYMDVFEKELGDWVSLRSKDAQSTFENSLHIAISSVAFVSIFIITFLLLLQRKIKPLHSLMMISEKMANGDFNVQVKALKSKDEVAQLFQTFRIMIENMKMMIQQIQVASNQLSSSAQELMASSEQSTHTAEQVSYVIQHVSDGAELQTSSLENNLLALNKVNDTIERFTTQTENINDMAGQITIQAKDGVISVNKTVDQMGFINASVSQASEKINELLSKTEKIDNITATISDISEQTNLLALNAAIEAARAGEYGRGFAVVADEVRNLAEQSRNSAKNIENIIKTIQDETSQAFTLMQNVVEVVANGIDISTESKDKFSQIQRSLQSLTPLLKEMANHSKHVLDQVNYITENEQNLVNVAHENEKSSEEVAAASQEQLATMEEVTSSAQTLSAMAEELQDQIAKFHI